MVENSALASDGWKKNHDSACLSQIQLPNYLTMNLDFQVRL